MATHAQDSDLTGISVLYSQKITHPKVRLSRRARGAARRTTMPSSKKRISPVDPKQNNPNDIGAKIISPGQGMM